MSFYFDVFGGEIVECCADCGGISCCDYGKIDASELVETATKLFVEEGYDAALKHCRESETLKYKCAWVRYSKPPTPEELMLSVIHRCWDDFIEHTMFLNFKKRRNLRDSYMDGTNVEEAWSDYTSYEQYVGEVSKYVPFMEELYLYGFEEWLERKPTEDDLLVGSDCFLAPFFEYLWKQSSSRRHYRFYLNHMRDRE